MRYQLERLRQVNSFDSISDTILDSLREFFLERLYPPMEMRIRLDVAFEDISMLLRSPGRLGPLVKAALPSMLRISMHLPAIITTGIATVDALHETRQLEKELMIVADKIQPELKQVLDKKVYAESYREVMLKLIAGVPEKTVHTLIDNVIHDILSRHHILNKCNTGVKINLSNR